jgi:hypothetical protein
VSETPPRQLPEGFTSGPIQGVNIIGEVTEALHRFLLDGWTFPTPPPRIEEDLSFVPKDREEVVYVYMYRAAHNTNLQNSKQWRPARISLYGPTGPSTEQVFYERAPIYLNLFYLLSVHSKFRSEAERLMGWVLTRLHDATHLVYRPRRYVLPSGKPVDSAGRPWKPDAEGDDLIYEKVALALVDDLAIGDAINFFTINEAPYRPYLTYRAMCSMEGRLLAGPPTLVRHHRTVLANPDGEGEERPNGRLGGRDQVERPTGPKMHIGPAGFGHRPIEDNESED